MLYPHLRQRVYVTPDAASPIFRPVDDAIAQNIKRRYQIDSEFILAVGNLQPRKNLLRLIEAFALMRSEAEHVKLVIVGKASWQTSEVYKAECQFRLQSSAVFTGYVPDEDLVMLYNSAKMLAYPSIYEGFGLPVLEAMACGTPVLTSNISSLPEVAGSAAILVDPTNVTEIANGMYRLLSNRELADSLRAAGLQQAAQFSWSTTAETTLNVYRRVLGQG